MNKGWKYALGIAVIGFLTNSFYRLERVGWEGVFPWPKWVMHKNGETGVVVGRLEKAEYYNGDGDMTIEVRPIDEYKHMILNRDGVVGGNGNGRIELEVEVRDDAQYASAYLTQLKYLMWRDVFAIGVLVDDMEIPPKSELHTVEIIYGLFDGDATHHLYKLVAATDDSWIQHPPLSDKPTRRTVVFDFPPSNGGTPKYKVDVIKSVNTEAKYVISDNRLTLEIMMLSRKDKDGPAAYIADITTYWE